MPRRGWGEKSGGGRRGGETKDGLGRGWAAAAAGGSGAEEGAAEEEEVVGDAMAGRFGG